jgi:hypothetical protein
MQPGNLTLAKPASRIEIEPATVRFILSAAAAAHRSTSLPPSRTDNDVTLSENTARQRAEMSMKAVDIPTKHMSY